MLDDSTPVDSGGFDQFNEQRIYRGDRSGAHAFGGRERAEHRERNDASVRHHERTYVSNRHHERNGAADRHRERDDPADQQRGRNAQAGQQCTAVVSTTRRVIPGTKRLAPDIRA